MKQRNLVPHLTIALSALTLFALLAAGRAEAQTYTKLYTFPIDSRNHSGIVPPGLTVQGRDGDLYSTIADDGPQAAGSAFKITPQGQYTQLYAFCQQTACLDGAHPYGGLTMGRNGNLYGTTANGGKYNGGSGTIFTLTESGKLTKLYDFTSKADGGYPQYPPFQAANGNLYGAGTEVYAGAYGRIYRLTPKRQPPHEFTSLVNFNFSDGATPNLPVRTSKGTFYGTTQAGGDATCRCGEIFKLTPTNTLKVLHRFQGWPADGNLPYGAFVEGNDGNFYGTTYAGGTYNQGTIFKITPAGKFTLLHSFQYSGSVREGKNPVSGLELGSDGNFYGSLAQGGQYGYGALYRVTPAGSVTVVYSFCPAGGSCSDGYGPQTPLVQHTNGKFYGSTAGNSLGGSVFYSLDVGLPAFVRLLSPGGRTGEPIEILGQGFSGARAVLFGGTPARFAVASDGALTAVVPAYATSGFVRVLTTNGTLASNRAFIVAR